VQIEAPEAVEEAERKRREEAEARMRFTHAESSALNAPEAPPQPGPGGQPPVAEEERVETFVREEKKVGRNEPCPCGSGKKFKHCHGKAA
jgi:preprotein translocase subunit SecA